MSVTVKRLIRERINNTMNVVEMASAHVKNVEQTLINLRNEEAKISQEIKRLEGYLNECYETLGYEKEEENE